MANIRVDLDYQIVDGQPLTFIAPCPCSEVSGLTVYYPIGQGQILSKEFKFSDAHGNDLSNINNLFNTNAYVKVILNTRNGVAYIQNADTNAYLEGKFENINNKFSEVTSIEKGGTGATSAEEARDNLGVDFAYEGILTATDDLNTIKTNGVYLYDTGDVPQNCPFLNAGIVEVLGEPNATTTRKIQRVSRYGSTEIAFRGLSTGGWSNWIIINTSSNEGAMKGELLWTNASPGSSFSPQTISLSKLGIDSLSPYSFLIVQFVVSTGASTHQSSAPIFRSTGTYSTQYENSDGKELRRLVSATVGGGVTFEAGKKGETTDNAVMIPEKIYGFKLS